MCGSFWDWWQVAVPCLDFCWCDGTLLQINNRLYSPHPVRNKESRAPNLLNLPCIGFMSLVWLGVDKLPMIVWFIICEGGGFKERIVVSIRSDKVYYVDTIMPLHLTICQIVLQTGFESVLWEYVKKMGGVVTVKVRQCHLLACGW